MRRAPRHRGSAVVDALVAVALMAAATAVVAAAATTNLRAVARASATTSLTALAARELALLEAGPLAAASADVTREEVGIGTVRRRARVVPRADGVVELVVAVEHPGATALTLVAHVLPPE